MSHMTSSPYQAIHIVTRGYGISEGFEKSYSPKKDCGQILRSSPELDVVRQALAVEVGASATGGLKPGGTAY